MPLGDAPEGDICGAGGGGLVGIGGLVHGAGALGPPLRDGRGWACNALGPIILEQSNQLSFSHPRIIS